MKKNVVFIGMMGTFKSATAEVVANALKLPLIDTDAVFERQFGSIDDFFADRGEAAFREEEHRIVVEAAARDGAVISCGGGAVLRPDNMQALRQSGVIVLLTASDAAIIERVGRAETRPLLKQNVAENVKRISAERRDLYARYADLTIDNTYLTVDACGDAVLKRLRMAANGEICVE